MTSLVIISTCIIGFVGILTATWSYINTRNKYYEEYKTRKKIK